MYIKVIQSRTKCNKYIISIHDIYRWIRVAIYVKSLNNNHFSQLTRGIYIANLTLSCLKLHMVTVYYSQTLAGL